MSKQKQILINAFGPPNSSSGELLFQCPKCGHHKKKLSINLEKNVFKCWVCDFSGKDISFLLKKYANQGLYSTWRRLTGTQTSYVEDRSVEIIRSLELPNEFQSLASPSAPRKYLDYLEKRSVFMDDILKWKVGYCASGKYASRIVVPSFDKSGELTYFVARSTEDNQYVKYKNPPTSKDIIFNDLMVDWSKPVVIVEGIFDAMRFENSIPILGSTLHVNSKLFRKICQRGAKIYLGLDRDASKKEDKIISNLLLNGIEIYKMSPPKRGDYADLTRQQCLEIKEKSHFVQGTDYLLYKKIFLEDF